MFVTLAGFIFSTAFFSAIAVAVLSFAAPKLRILTFVAFLIFAHLGAITFLILYGRLFGSPSGELGSGKLVAGLIIGAPIFATLVGWLAAYIAGSIGDKLRRLEH